MTLTRLLRSESARVAVGGAVLFVIATAVLIAVVLWIVADTQRAALSQANDDDIATLLAGFNQEGLGEAKEILRQRVGDSSDGASMASQIFMRLQGRDEHHSVGNLPLLPETVGNLSFHWFPANGSVVQGPDGGRGGGVLIFGRGVRLDDAHYLFVGRGTSALFETRERILAAFLWVMLGSIIAAAVGGYVLASRLMRQVDTISRTCERFVAGRLTERLATTGSGGEWDRLASAINEMLNRISGLLENLQQVSSDIAHDLRTPLTRMRHRLETARLAATSAPEYLSAIDRAIDDTDQLLALFSSLLSIAQIEAGTRVAAFRPLNLADVLGKIYELYRPVAEDSGRTLHLGAVADTPIKGDPELLLQMLSNLVENAIRHTPLGTQITMQLKAGRGLVTLKVQDDGEGIPSQDIGKVTRRFYRVEGSRSSPGHGLGLALVNAIAQLHGTKLELANAAPGLIAAMVFEL